MIKKLPANAGNIGDMGLIPGSKRSPGRGHGNPLQYSCLENPMNRGAWQATVHGVAESDMTEVTACVHTRHIVGVCEATGSVHVYVMSD